MKLHTIQLVMYVPASKGSLVITGTVVSIIKFFDASISFAFAIIIYYVFLIESIKVSPLSNSGCNTFMVFSSLSLSFNTSFVWVRLFLGSNLIFFSMKVLKLLIPIFQNIFEKLNVYSSVA